MDMAFKSKTDVEVALNVLEDRMQKMEKLHLIAKEHLEMHLMLIKEQISHAAIPFHNRKKDLRQ